MGDPKIGRCFAAAQFCFNRKIKVAFADVRDDAEIFARNIVEQFDRRTLFQAHHTDEIMRAIAGYVERRAQRQRLFDKQARR